MKESLYFVYNGVNSQDLGITQVQVNADMYQEQFLSDITIQEIQIRHKKTPYLQGVQRAPLQFTLSFAFDLNQNPTALQQISRLFWTEQYLPFYTSDNPNRIWMCMPVDKSTITHNGLGQGYVEMTMRCDSPYAYMPTVTTKVYDLSQDNYTESTQANFQTGTLTNVVATTSNGLQLPTPSPMTFARASVAYQLDGKTQVASGVPRYENGYFQNLLANDYVADFEGTPAQFGVSGWNNVTYSQSTDQAYHGTHSLKVVTAGNTGAEGVALETNLNVPFTSGTYVGSLYIYGVSGQVDVWLRKEGTNLVGQADGTKVTVTLNGQWQRVATQTITISSTEQISDILLFARTTTTEAITFYVDCAQIEMGSTPKSWILPSQAKGILIEEGTTNLVLNSDFETVTGTAQVFNDGLTTDLSAWTTQSGGFGVRTTTTTNLVKNSDFEVVSGTATVFSDALTSYTGSTVPAPWTGRSGTWTFSASGATSSGGTASTLFNTAVISAGNPLWKPLAGQLLTVQATFTTGASSNTHPSVFLFIDSNNGYRAQIGSDGKTFYITKVVGGTLTDLTNFVMASPLSFSTSYTITLSIDPSGNLTAKLYSGVGTGGTLLQTLNTTDNSLTGGFLFGVGADSGITISNTQVTAPWANGWTIGGDSRVAWAITNVSPINATYSLSAVGVASGVTGYAQSSQMTISPSTAYILSGYVNTTSVGANGVKLYLGWNDSSNSFITSATSNAVSGTTATQRISVTSTSPSNGAYSYISARIYDSGTATFDEIQLETGSTATLYARNDSTSASYTAPVGAQSTANSAWMSAGNTAWKPLLGSGSQVLALTAQATFTTPSFVPTEGLELRLFQDAQNLYRIQQYNGMVYLQKVVANTWTTLRSAAQALATSTTYTATLSLDTSGNLTAKLYQGADTNGTLLQTLTIVDNSLTGGFLVGVGADNGVVVSNVKMTAPWADGWSIGGDKRIAWALTKNAIAGTYSASAVGVATGVNGWATQNISMTSGQTYTVSAYANSQSVTGSGTYVYMNFPTSGSAIASAISGTRSVARYSASGTPANTGTGAVVIQQAGAGTVTFDSVQVEQKKFASSYLRNDSTSSSATRASETLSLPSSIINPNAGTVRMLYIPQYNAGDAQSSALARPLFVDNTGNLKIWRYQGISNPNYVATFEYHDSSGNRNYQDLNAASQVITAGVPVDIAFSWNNGTLKAYANGVLLKTWTMTVTTPHALGSNLYVGYDGGGGFANGIFDELVIYNRALSDTEVAALCNPTTELAISDSMTLLAHFKSNLTYGQGGYRISQPISLDWIGNVNSTSISWTGTTPTNTAISIYTSIDGGVTWQQATNNGGIPSVTAGQNLSGVNMLVKESLTTTDVTVTPSLTSFNVSESGYLTINNAGDIPVYPEIWITKIGAGDVTITNTSNGNAVFSFTGLADQEIVYIDNETQYITSSLEATNNIYRYNNFNDNYMMLVVGQNNFQVTGACQIQFRFMPRLLAGLTMGS